MTYTNLHRWKIDGKLDDYEQEVYDAMKAAGYDDWEEHDFTLFTPTNDLYLLYLEHIRDLRWRESGMKTLTKQQFGVALSVAFDLEAEDRGRRRVHGSKIVRGVYHLKGPATVRVRDQRGRRPKTHDSYVD